MSDDMHDIAKATELCVTAQNRLWRNVSSLSETEVREPTLLPGWTVAHVLTHLARNADAHSRRVEGALEGREVSKYPRGASQRKEEIDAGASRKCAELLADLEASQGRLESAFLAASAAGWPNGFFRADAGYCVLDVPFHRLREVEMHHVDLNIGYTIDDWPEQYVAWELPHLLSTVVDRASPNSRHKLVAWLAGRLISLPSSTLAPWG